MGCKYMLTIPSCNFDPAIECPDDLQEAQLSMEASKSYKHVVASFLPSTNEQKGLPPDYRLQCGEDACVVIGIHVNHWEKDK